MRRVIFIVLLLKVVGIALIGHAPAPVNAGGFPCFMCHGVHFEGSDLAPTVAGTKLTDEQIANQMRHPRGLMPAFGPTDWPDPQTAISYIRAQPTGQPTMALSPQQRSAALALLAGVAAARATAVLEAASSTTVISTPTPAPSATVAAAPSLIPAAANPAASVPSALPGSAPPADTSTPLGLYVAGAGLLCVVVGAAWTLRRRNR